MAVCLCWVSLHLQSARICLSVASQVPISFRPVTSEPILPALLYTLRSSVPKMAAVAMATQQPRYMDATEIRLARQWLQEDDVFVAEIARRLRRSPFSLWRLFGGEASAAKGVLTSSCCH